MTRIKDTITRYPASLKTAQQQQQIQKQDELGCLLFSIGSANSGTKLHGEDEKEKLYFPLLKSVKHQKAL